MTYKVSSGTLNFCSLTHSRCVGSGHRSSDLPAGAVNIFEVYSQQVQNLTQVKARKRNKRREK